MHHAATLQFLLQKMERSVQNAAAEKSTARGFCRVSQDFDGVFMEHEIPPVQQGKINLQIAYRVPLHPLF